MKPLQTCVRCVMNDSSPGIQFDEGGVCNCCSNAFARMPSEWLRGQKGKQQLTALVDRIRKHGEGKPYDAMIGLSGGVDSAYLAHVLATQYGLRLLAVHVDGGWNSEAAVRNIEILVRALNIDLHTYVVEWEEMKDLQLAFLRASVLNQDMPQDHAFFTTLYRTAHTFKVRDFLSGVNFSSECIVPPNGGYPAMDGRHLRGVHAQLGHKRLNTFPVMSVFEYLWMTRVRRQLVIQKPLNYLDYDKNQAKSFLIDHYGYRDYGSKHSESRFTKFYQDIYLPERYGFDKRRLHLSSQIVAGQITRDEALKELATPLCDAHQSTHEIKFISKKLGIPVDELHHLIQQPPISHESYPNSISLYRAGAKIKSLGRYFGASK